jgi:hypothetical protein
MDGEGPITGARDDVNLAYVHAHAVSEVCPQLLHGNLGGGPLPKSKMWSKHGVLHVDVWESALDRSKETLQVCVTLGAEMNGGGASALRERADVIELKRKAPK